jgi:hypothetical protein
VNRGGEGRGGERRGEGRGVAEGMGLAAEGKIVQQVELYKWRSTIWRLDVWPFLGAYVAWVVGVATRLDSTDAGIVLAAIAVLHVLTFLFSAWSVDFRCLSQASKVRMRTPIMLVSRGRTELKFFRVLRIE